MLCVSLLTNKAMSKRMYTAKPRIDECCAFGEAAWRKMREVFGEAERQEMPEA